MQSNLFSANSYLFLLTSLAVVASAQGAEWSQDMSASLRRATNEKKDVLVYFSGTDWAEKSGKLEQEVFSQEAFQKGTSKQFILVQFDVPQDDSKVPAAVVEQRNTWAEKFGLRMEAIPIVFLTDERGQPYATTGYRPGGATKFVDHLTTLAKIRAMRDQALAKAATATGAEKAKLLDTALSTVGEDLAATVYLPQAQQILELDPQNAQGLKAKYAPIVQKLTFEQAIAELPHGEGEWENSLKEIEKLLAKFAPTGKSRAEILFRRVHALQALDRKPEALKTVDEITSLKGLPSTMSVPAELLKADILAGTKRTDEALKVLDGLLAREDGKQMSVVVIRNKAMILKRAGRTGEALKVLDSAIAATSDAREKDDLKRWRDILTFENKGGDSKKTE